METIETPVESNAGLLPVRPNKCKSFEESINVGLTEVSLESLGAIVPAVNIPALN